MTKQGTARAGPGTLGVILPTSMGATTLEEVADLMAPKKRARAHKKTHKKKAHKKKTTRKGVTQKKKKGCACTMCGV